MSGNKLQPRKKSSFLKYKPFFSLLDTIDLTRFLPLTGIVEIDNQRFNVNMKIELSALFKKKKNTNGFNQEYTSRKSLSKEYHDTIIAVRP